MPFGAVFGALFFSIFGIWAVASSSRSIWSETPAVRLFLVVVCVTLALGLLNRRAWARWGGALLAAALVAATLRFGRYESAVEYLWLFGSLTTLGLLLVPATGGSAVARTGVARSGGLLGWAATAGSVGLLVSLVGVLPAELGELDEKGRADGGPVVPAGLPDRVRWTDFGAGLDRARSEDKPMLVTFVTNWCGYCSKMDRTTWKHPGVIERMADVVAVRVDAEDSRDRNGYTGARLAQEFGVDGFPTIVLLDGGGRVISRTGGYQEPRQLLGWLDDAFQRIGEGSPVRPMRVSAPQ